jgi:gentisate 1,2-dioxygenase
METTEVIRIGPDAFRRNVGLETGSKTLAMGFQIVLPGEAAAAHRHTNTALASSSKAAARIRHRTASRW